MWERNLHSYMPILFNFQCGFLNKLGLMIKKERPFPVAICRPRSALSTEVSFTTTLKSYTRFVTSSLVCDKVNILLKLLPGLYLIMIITINTVIWLLFLSLFTLGSKCVVTRIASWRVYWTLWGLSI